jgi:hypothetical protein
MMRRRHSSNALQKTCIRTPTRASKRKKKSSLHVRREERAHRAVIYLHAVRDVASALIQCELIVPKTDAFFIVVFPFCLFVCFACL